jgi:hypothetical protein
MAERPEVAEHLLARLRAVCLGLPEAYEEPAWAGTRWRIRTRTFAHVIRIDGGWPPAYARAAGSAGPLTVLTFRSSGPELHALGASRHPFFRPVWFDDIVGMVLDDDTDWEEVGELLTESFCLLAPPGGGCRRRQATSTRRRGQRSGSGEAADKAGADERVT